MKIKEIHIDGFGKWVDQDFTIADNPQVIFGNNEAGKTTLAVFIRSILFGFANAKGKNRFQQYKPRHATAYGGSLLVEVDGRDYRIKRGPGKAGGKVTVTDFQGHRFGPVKLAELLGNVDRDLYQAIFGFSQADLATVEDINQSEVQHHLQQLGAVGSNEWEQFITKLSKKADELFKPRGRKPVLNQQLKEYQLVQGKLQAAREKYDDYTQLVAKRDSAQQHCQQLEKQLKALTPRGERLEQLHRLWPVYAQWQSSHQQTHLVKLSDAQVNQVDQLRAEEQEVQRQVRAAREQQAQFKGQLQQLDQADLNDYHEHQAEYQQLQAKLLQLQAQVDHYHQQAQAMEERFRERNQLQERYGHQLPQPLMEPELGQLEHLLKDDNVVASTNQKAPLGLAGLAVLLLIIGLAGHHGILGGLGAVLLVGAGYWYYQLRANQQRVNCRAQQALTEFGARHGLSNFPVDQWLPMQGDLHRAVELNNALKQNQAVAAGQKQQLAEIKQRLAGKASGDTVAELAHSYAAWLNMMAERWQNCTVVKQQMTTVDQQLTSLTARLRDVQNDKWKIYQSVGVGNDEDFNHYLQTRARMHHQQATAAAYEEQLSAQDKAELSHYDNEDQLQDQLQNVHHQISTAQVTLRQEKEVVQQTRLAIESLVKDGTLAELEQRQANLAAQIWQSARRWVSYQLTVSWINRALVLASADRYPAIISAAEQFFATLTADHYSKILLTDDGVAVLTDQQEQFAVGELSTGTAEQLYVALRLGFISVMSDQVSLPIVIDDSFVNFDHVRRDRIFKLLKQLAANNQVLFFTANDQALNLAPVINLNQLNNE